MRTVLASVSGIVMSLVVLCVMGVGTSVALAAPHGPVGPAAPDSPNYQPCSSTYLVLLDDKTESVGNGQLEVRLYRTQDSVTHQICDYFGEAIETSGPSGTLQATIDNYSCGGPHTNSMSSGGTASLDSPYVPNGTGNYKAVAQIGSYTPISTICTS